jgi:hypothetical protein
VGYQVRTYSQRLMRAAKTVAWAVLYQSYERFYRNVLKKASGRPENLGLGGARAESYESVEKTVIQRHSRPIHSRKARKATIVDTTTTTPRLTALLTLRPAIDHCRYLRTRRKLFEIIPPFYLMKVQPQHHSGSE